MKRILDIVTILVLSSFVVSFVNPPHFAHASELKNFSRVNPSKFTHPFRLNREKITFFSDEMSQAEFNKRFDALEKSLENDSYVIYSENNDNIYYYIIDKTKPLKLENNTSMYYLKFARVATYQFDYNINKKYYILRPYDYGYNANFVLTPRDSGGIVSIHAKQRIEYPDGYEGDTFVGGDSPVFEITRKKECDNLDFVCFFKKALSSTISTIQDLFKGITHLVEGFFEFLKNIFIPSDTNFFAGFFKQMDGAIHKKLGFLTFPFDFFHKSFQALFDGIKADDMREWHCGRPGTGSEPAVCRGVCIQKLLGNESVCVRFGVLEEVAPWLWIVIMPIMRAAFVVFLCFRVADKYFEVMEA